MQHLFTETYVATVFVNELNNSLLEQNSAFNINFVCMYVHLQM